MLILSTGEYSDIIEYLEKHRGSIRGRVILSRNVVDTLLSSNDHSHLSDYKCSTSIIKSLVFYWSLWRDEVSNVIQSLHHFGNSNTGEFSGEYIDFCLNYLGVEKSQNEEDGDVGILYTPLYPDACWVKAVYDKIKPCFVDPQHLASTANSYWRKEFICLTKKVVEKLEFLHRLSVEKHLPLISQGVLLYNLLHVAKRCEGVDPDTYENHLGWVVHSAFLEVFLLHHPKKDFVISTRGNSEYSELIQRLILLDIGSSGCLTEGQLGRVVVAFFLFSNLPNEFTVTIRRRVEESKAWEWLGPIVEVVLEKAVYTVKKNEDNKLVTELEDVCSVLDLILREDVEMEKVVLKLSIWKRLVQPVVSRLLRRRTWVEPVLSEPVWRWACSGCEKEAGFRGRILRFFLSM